MSPQFPGIPSVINGNGAVAHVMQHVCGGVIGYPITPSTEISELYEAFRAGGGCNVWGRHPFFFNPEGEHSAQSGALGAALTGGKYVSNASSSQGILYGLESHYVTVGKKVGGFVLQVAARVVSKHSLNVMAGHDDVYALLSAGYTILFGSNPQEAADLAAIAYKVSALSLIPVANAMDGFATSHMLCEALLPEPDLLRDFLGDPAGRIASPTVAQDILFGAKGRVFQLLQFLARHEAELASGNLPLLRGYLDAASAKVEADNAGALVDGTLGWIPEKLHAPWRRQWLGAFQKGTRPRVPALVDIHNPGLTGGVQNQPDFQAGAADHRTHFVNDVPRFVRQAMAEYGELTGRVYNPVNTFLCDDAAHVVVGLGSVTDDAEAVATYLRAQGKRVGVISIKLLQPFPEGELITALRGKQAVTVLERSDMTALTGLVSQALFRARENADHLRHAGIPPIDKLPRLTTAIFGLGAHDLQPRHLIAAFRNMEDPNGAAFVYLGSQFFTAAASPRIAALQARMRSAYPETVSMALATEPNPPMLPQGAFRTRFHSVGGYGTIATGKLLTDILAGALDLHSKSAPKYGSEKSGAPTNYYITLSPDPVKITNAELEDVEIVVSPDHKVFSHTDPLRGLARAGTFILQSSQTPLEAWRDLPAKARQGIRDRKIRFFVVDAFAVARKHAPTPDLQTRMMGIAFIGAVCGHVDRIVADASQQAMLDKIREQIAKKFGAKGGRVVDGNMAVIREGLQATQAVDYDAPGFAESDISTPAAARRGVAISASMCRAAAQVATAGFVDRDYYDDVVGSHFRDGTVAEAAVLPGTGLFMPAGSAAWKDKGLFRLNVPEFIADRCTGCMECAIVCPDAAIPNSVHDIDDLLLTALKLLDVSRAQRDAMRARIPSLGEAVRAAYRRDKAARPLHALVAEAVVSLDVDNPVLRRNLTEVEASAAEFDTVDGVPADAHGNGLAKPVHDMVADAVAALDIDNAVMRRNLGRLADLLADFPVARTRPFFDAMEKASPGSGGLFSVGVDPWKCSGCMACTEVCGPGALVERQQDTALLNRLQKNFEFLSRTPNTSPRFMTGATDPDGEAKRLLLDRNNYYAMTGGHGACRGCGEVTAIRLVIAANRALHTPRQHAHMRELERLIAGLQAKRATVRATDADPQRGARIARTLATLEQQLYLFESGPTGDGPASAVIANATGCSSVFASTFPFNPYNDPWVNSLFQDSAPVAKGIFEGLSAAYVEDFRAVRVARLELDDAYDPLVHDAFFKYFRWSQFSSEELGLLPTIISMGGDGATYDIGFGALSRLLVTDTPIKVVVLNSGVYSNTGGQASTASYAAQDSDLARFGTTQTGKQEDRKELGLIAAFHPNVFVAQTTAALPGHFLKSVLEFLKYADSPALLDVYTPCQGEQGIADAAASRHARLAVESRMSPVFVHDPRRGDSPSTWFSLDGNPAPEQDWATMAIDYVDADGNANLLEVPMTPADFAVRETRFKKHFCTLAPSVDAVPVHEYINLEPAARTGRTPFIWSTDAQRRLIRLAVDAPIIHLVEERLKYWRTLQHLAGLPARQHDIAHQTALGALQQRFADSVRERDGAIDQIARAMSELAASSHAPLGTGLGPIDRFVDTEIANPETAPDATEAVVAPIVTLAEEDMAKCTNCKTCYQDAPDLFEKTHLVVDGETRDVGRLIPGVLERVKVTTEAAKRIARVAANCDAEIIR
jgi:pyruvate-ferredoxin/flavodoxin oxidoreductase